MTDDTAARLPLLPHGLPWERETGRTIRDRDGFIVAQHTFRGRAEFDVRAANSFCAMRDALKEALDALEIMVKDANPEWDGSATPTSVCGKVRAALALAEKAS